MKKLINDVQDVLDEQLAGLAKAHPSLTLHHFRMFHVKHLYEKSGNGKMDGDSCAQAPGRTRSA